MPCFLLVWEAPGGQATWASAVYVGSLLGLLGTSALYHGIHWTPRARYWVARIDLLMIFVLIAGTCTPIIMLRLEPRRPEVVLAGLWGAVLAGGILKAVWRQPPKWASAAVFVGFGSLALLFLPQVVAGIGVPATVLMLVGGLLYVVGAIVYGLERPDPFPAVFGYHEMFHALVVAAATIHFVTIALYIVPSGP